MNVRAQDLTTEQKSHLVTGVGPWNTFAIAERGIETVKLSDGPHGLRAQGAGGDNFALTPSEESTCFPPAVALGSSWDSSVVARVARAIAREARMLGVDIVLGPGVNIKRSPLCGRNFEYLSEDPLLSGVLGAAYVNSLQAHGVGASVKHFAVNNQETDRMRVSADVDERTLREIYLPAFERIVQEAQPATVMCSYNKINGVFSSQNRWLLTDLLRGEWGYNGAVISDWGAVHDTPAAVAAGLDLEMPGTEGRTPPIVAEAVAVGALSEVELNTAVDRVLNLSEWRDVERVSVDFDEHHALARQVASECAVLLKNDGVLPLEPSARVAVIGEFARAPRFQGGGSSHVRATRIDSFLDAVAEVAEGGFGFEPGYSLDGSESDAALRDAAVALAASAEVAVIFAGLSEAEESEGFDRETIELPAAQGDLIRSVAATGVKTVVVLSNGGVVALEGWHDDVDAILEGFLLGQAGGSAISDLLYGVVNPSGKLAETIPYRVEDHPSTVNFPGERGHVLYGERLHVGYRAFTTLGRTPRYPFGHGLSYTTFETSAISVQATSADTAIVRLTVTNTGERDGAHVVQIYVGATGVGEVQRPLRELRAFKKVMLAAGASTQVELALDRRAFAYWDVEQGEWVVTPGSYAVQIGADSETVIAEHPIELTGDDTVRELTLWSTLAEWVEHPIIGPVLLDEVDSDRLRLVTQPHILRGIGTLPMEKIANTLRDSVPPETFERLMARTRRQG
ncbi:beta-glucosidase [Microbacterium sp. ZKA21]|uniref:beta-glucosidase n=1 Tax=Microbacterium sp. ZKA21 TaxID=3381694 RepID=UPI003D216991